MLEGDEELEKGRSIVGKKLSLSVGWSGSHSGKGMFAQDWE